MKRRRLVFMAILSIVATMLANWGGATVTLAPTTTQSNDSGLVAFGAEALLEIVEGRNDE